MYYSVFNVLFVCFNNILHNGMFQIFFNYWILYLGT